MNCATKNQDCKTTDLAAEKRVWLIWGVPGILFFLGVFWAEARTPLWISSLSFAGLACVVNAARCGRLHCHLTGPLYLLGALTTLLNSLKVLAVDWQVIFALVIGGTLFGYILEFFRGRYIRG